MYRQRRINAGLLVLDVLLIATLLVLWATDGDDRVQSDASALEPNGAPAPDPSDTTAGSDVDDDAVGDGSGSPAPTGTDADDSDTSGPRELVAVDESTDRRGSGEPSTTTAPATTLAPDDGKSSSERRLVDAFTVRGEELQPKSVVATEDGLFFAQNMMYRHNVSVYDREGSKLATIPDEVDLGALGVEGGGIAEGSPVEAAVTPDGRHVYVSNYKMYGDGWNPVADDDCDRGEWDDSFVYKIDTSTFEIVAAIPTGAVPKYLAVSPDGRRLVVSNWCGFDVSIIDTATDAEVTRVDVGRHPRGIAITDDSRFAYVTVMGEAKIVVVDLRSNAVVNTLWDAGTTPRHLELSPDGRYLYVSNNLANMVRKIDLRTNQSVGAVTTGNGTRTIALTDDGESLFVVNYHDGTVSKIATADMTILQTEYSGVHPVGVTYDPGARQVWVANYAGELRVFEDR